MKLCTPDKLLGKSNTATYLYNYIKEHVIEIEYELNNICLWRNTLMPSLIQ